MNVGNVLKQVVKVQPRPIYKPILRLTVDGSVLGEREQVVVNSENFVNAMKNMNIQVKESDLVPGKGLVIKIKNLC